MSSSSACLQSDSANANIVRSCSPECKVMAVLSLESKSKENDEKLPIAKVEEKVEEKKFTIKIMDLRTDKPYDLSVNNNTTFLDLYHMVWKVNGNRWGILVYKMTPITDQWKSLKLSSLGIQQDSTICFTQRLVIRDNIS